MSNEYTSFDLVNGDISNPTEVDSTSSLDTANIQLPTFSKSALKEAALSINAAKKKLNLGHDPIQAEIDKKKEAYAQEEARINAIVNSPNWVNDYEFNTTFGRIKNLGAGVAAGTQRLVATALASPAAAIESIADYYIAGQDTPSPMAEALRDSAENVTESLQAAGKQAFDKVNNTATAPAIQELENLSAAAAEKWDNGDKLGATKDILTNFLGFVTNRPGASLELFFQSLPNTAAAMNPIIATAAFAGYATEALDNAIEVHREKFGEEPSQEEISTKALLAMGVAASEILGDKFQGKILKSIIKNPIKAKSVAGGVATGIGKGAGEVATEAVQGTASSLFNQLAETKAGDKFSDRFKDVSGAKLIKEGTIEAAAASPYGSIDVIKSTLGGAKTASEDRAKKVADTLKEAGTFEETETSVRDSYKQYVDVASKEEVSEEEVVSAIDNLVGSMVNNPDSINSKVASSILEDIEENDLSVSEKTKEDLNTIAEGEGVTVGDVVGGVVKATKTTAKGVAAAAKGIKNAIKGTKERVKDVNYISEDEKYVADAITAVNEATTEEELLAVKATLQAKQVDLANKGKSGFKLYRDIGNVVSNIKIKESEKPKEADPELDSSIDNITSTTEKTTTKSKDTFMSALRLGSGNLNVETINKVLNSDNNGFSEEEKEIITLHRDMNSVSDEIRNGDVKEWKGTITKYKQIRQHIANGDIDKAKKEYDSQVRWAKFHNEVKVPAFKLVRKFNRQENFTKADQAKLDSLITNVEKTDGRITKFDLVSNITEEVSRGRDSRTNSIEVYKDNLNSLINLSVGTAKDLQKAGKAMADLLRGKVAVKKPKPAEANEVKSKEGTDAYEKAKSETRERILQIKDPKIKAKAEDALERADTVEKLRALYRTIEKHDTAPQTNKPTTTRSVDELADMIDQIEQAQSNEPPDVEPPDIEPPKANTITVDSPKLKKAKLTLEVDGKENVIRLSDYINSNLKVLDELEALWNCLGSK